MINNRGQILPLFIILVPILIIFIAYMVDLGTMYTEKRKMENITKDAISYFLDNRSNPDIYNKTKEYINKNVSNVEISIEDGMDSISITVIKKHKSIYNIININTEIRVRYTGYYDGRIIKG